MKVSRLRGRLLRQESRKALRHRGMSEFFETESQREARRRGLLQEYGFRDNGKGFDGSSRPLLKLTRSYENTARRSGRTFKMFGDFLTLWKNQAEEEVLYTVVFPNYAIASSTHSQFTRMLLAIPLESSEVSSEVHSNNTTVLCSTHGSKKTLEIRFRSASERPLAGNVLLDHTAKHIILNRLLTPEKTLNSSRYTESAYRSFTELDLVAKIMMDTGRLRHPDGK